MVMDVVAVPALNNRLAISVNLSLPARDVKLNRGVT
jgi:hypothetical protein